MSKIVANVYPYPVLNRSQFYLLTVILLILGVSIAILGTENLPPDNHEILVVRTAQEMHNCNDWIVPYFNGEPRLNKPPLSYWLTGLIATLDNSIDRIHYCTWAYCFHHIGGCV